jgi:hypothetical protein
MLIASGLILAVVFDVQAKPHNPESLSQVIQMSERTTQSGGNPVVVIDLDDTLINTRERNFRILLDFVRQSEVRKSFPAESKRVLGVEISQIRYLLTDTLGNIGITNSEFVAQANAFWLGRFFTNEYCRDDRANPGAAKFLHLLARAGAKLVYLTGRDWGRMGLGTSLNLQQNRFPVNTDQSILIMKEDPKQSDVTFKENQFPKIQQMGTVIAVIENEPANLNAMAKFFPTAQAIFLDTIHSPKPDVPVERAEWVADFKLKRKSSSSVTYEIVPLK